MCIQQPQDSSQRSAVIAHYNQSSWAHLGSPFRILHWEKHKTKPQSSTDPSPAVCPTQTSAAGAKGEDQVLWQGLSAEDSKAQGQGRGAGEGTACSCGSIRTAQGQSLNRGSSSVHSGAGMSCRPRAFPSHWAPSNHPGSPAMDLQGKSRARAGSSNEQRRKWEHWGRDQVLDRDDGRKMPS